MLRLGSYLGNQAAGRGPQSFPTAGAVLGKLLYGLQTFFPSPDPGVKHVAVLISCPKAELLLEKEQDIGVRIRGAGALDWILGKTSQKDWCSRAMGMWHCGMWLGGAVRVG